MPLSFTEELVSEYYKHIVDNEGRPKYLVSEHIHYQMPKRGVKVKGWHDIDVLAIGREEVLIIQTKQYATFEDTKKESIQALQEFFKDAEKIVKQNYDVKDKKIRKIFVAEDMSTNIKNEMEQLGIEADWLGEIIKKFMQLLYDKWEPEYKKTGKISFGKEENNLTRILLSLTLNFDKELKKAEILLKERNEHRK